jgi:transcriptional regulator with XRE-family HTH domain
MRLIGALLTEYMSTNDRRTKTGRPPIAVPASLAQWTFVPKKLSAKEIKAKAVGGQKLETSAVPPNLVKQRLHELARAAQWGRWKPEEWPFNKSWKALKDLVLLALLAGLAPRIEHLANLDVRDVVLDCEFRDGTRGAALLFRGGDLGMKLRDETYEFAVRLPDELRDILIAWLHCNANEPTAHAKSGQAPRKYEDVRPLIPTRRKRARNDSQECHAALGDRVRGREATRTGYAVRPLVPVAPGSFDGYQAHRFRSTFTQEVERLGKKWREENLGHPLSGYHERVLAEVPVDHTEKDLGYRDLRTADGHPTARSEQLVALGVQLWWDELWGDGPYLLRGLDPDAIRDAHEHVELLEAEIQMLDRQISQLHHQVAQQLESALKRTELADRFEGSLHAHALRNEVDIRVEQREHLRVSRDAARRVRQEVLDREVLLPEDLSPEEHARAVAEVLAVIEGSMVIEVEAASLPLAAELTVTDVAELFGVTTQHVGRWRRGLSNPPLDPAEWVERNKRDFRYPALAIDDETLRRVPAEDPRQRLNAVLARRATLGYLRRPVSIAG